MAGSRTYRCYPRAASAADRANGPLHNEETKREYGVANCSDFIS